jgi:hypothetical protein
MRAQTAHALLLRLRLQLLLAAVGCWVRRCCKNALARVAKRWTVYIFLIFFLFSKDFLFSALPPLRACAYSSSALVESMSTFVRLGDFPIIGR